MKTWNAPEMVEIKLVETKSGNVESTSEVKGTYAKA